MKLRQKNLYIGEHFKHKPFWQNVEYSFYWLAAKKNIIESHTNEKRNVINAHLRCVRQKLGIAINDER